MRTTAELWLLWGKTGGDGTWHPALAHILDVGAVAEILTRHFARRLAELLSLDEEVAARVAAFLIASHDIGKLIAGFQQKAIPFQGWILPPGLPHVPEARSVGFDHGLESVIALQRWLSAILRRGLNETFPLSGDSGIRESNSARRSYFWFTPQGDGRWLGVVSILRKTSDESSMRNARAIPISWFGTRC